MSETRNLRRVLQGTVTSDKMAKTITVLVERTFAHPKYGKFMRRHKKYHAHDEEGLAKVGDEVEIEATRPLSATKRWRLLRVLVTAQLAGDVTSVAEQGAEGIAELWKPKS
jgi:small subunit ribosomal protein S17